MQSEDYYDILQFPEDYTGYDGRAVWDLIHSKIAFNAGDDGGWKSDFDGAIDGLHAMVSAVMPAVLCLLRPNEEEERPGSAVGTRRRRLREEDRAR